MKQKYWITPIFISLFFNVDLNGQLPQKTDNIITFFIDEYPEDDNLILSENKNINKNLSNQEIKKLCLLFDKKTNCETIQFPFNYGIFATYAGYLALSDLNGQITFPRKTQKNSINLLITTKISPIFMLKNTIAYWEINDITQAKMYKIERKQDKETLKYYWDVQEKDAPKNNKIPIHTIIIFANPKSIYVPIGITPTKNNTQLVLPKIYAKKDINLIRNALFILTIKPFFSSIKKIYKERPLGYEMHIV